jgi:hypothetical protein
MCIDQLTINICKIKAKTIFWTTFCIEEYFDQTIEKETIQQPSFISTKEVSYDVLLTPF